MPLETVEFPGVTLKQQFEANTSLSADSMSVLCIGRQMKTHDHDDSSSAEPVLTYSGGTQLSFTLQKAGTETVTSTQSGATRVYADSAKFSYLTASTIANPASPTTLGIGFVPRTSSVEFYTVTMSGTTKTASPFSLEGAAGSAIGTRGMLYGDSIRLGSGTFCQVTGIGFSTASDLIKNTAFLMSNPGTGASAVACLDFTGYITNNGSSYAEGSGVTVAQDSSTHVATATLPAQMHARSETAGSTGYIQLVSGKAYLEYTQQSTAYVGKVASVSDMSEVEGKLGMPSNSNPLSLAVYFAVAHSNGVPVYFTAVSSDTAQDYLTAAALVDKYSNIYSIVPACANPTVISALSAYVKNKSEDRESKIRRVLWYSADSTATTASDVYTDVVSKRYTSSYRDVCVYADRPLYNGEYIGNYALAAAAAGMRSGEPCHRPISNLKYSLFSVSEPAHQSVEDYKSLAKQGIWIIANNQDDIPINMRQLTTAMSNNNINLNEESCVANADNVALALCNVGSDLVGCSNINVDLLITLKVMIADIMDAKTINQSGSTAVGPQLLSWDLESLAQDSINLDHVNAYITCTPPRPFNRFNMTLTIL